MRYLLFMGITLLLFSCRTFRSGVNSEAEPMARKDSIVFISIRMWHDSLLQSNHINVLEVLTKPGTLKRPLTGEGLQENFLTCILMNKAGARDSFLLEHPLYKDVEVFGQNGQLSMQRLNLKEAQFFVRFQKKDYHTLVIKENTALLKARDGKIKEIDF